MVHGSQKKNQKSPKAALAKAKQRKTDTLSTAPTP